MFKKGLCSISFRSLSPLQIIEIAKMAGLDCIEWGSDVHAQPEDIEGISQIAELCKKEGIDCCSYGTYYRIGVNTIDEIYPYIRAAKALGTDTLRLWCGDKGSEDYTDEELEALYTQCKELADIAKKEKVYLCLECHIKTLTDDMQATKALMQRVSSEHFCMYWQPNQFKTEAENIQYAKSVADITKRIHVFNWEGKQKYPLIEAKEQWQRYLDCFEGGTLLLEFMPDGEPESLKTEAAALFKIAGDNK